MSEENVPPSEKGRRIERLGHEYDKEKWRGNRYVSHRLLQKLPVYIYYVYITHKYAAHEK